jgi:hypothetical protein
LPIATACVTTEINPKKNAARKTALVGLTDSNTLLAQILFEPALLNHFRLQKLNLRQYGLVSAIAPSLWGELVTSDR